MPIQIINVRNTTIDKADDYLKQIAAWHFQEWGTITKQTLRDFEVTTKKLFDEKGAEYFVALDTEAKEVVGTLSLKTRNMQDEYPDHGWGPWLSGLYVKNQFRKSKISAMLAKAVLQFAQEKNVNYLYYFTHNHALSDFYNQLQGEQLKPFLTPERPYFYRGAPILVYRALTTNLVKVCDEYLAKVEVKTDAANGYFTPKSTAAIQSKL